MKARLTSISLTTPGRVIAIGEIVERGVDLPEWLFDARLAAETAELVEDGELKSLSADGSPVSAGSGAGADGAASQAGGDTGGPSSPAEVSSGVEQQQARLAHNQEVAGAIPAPAPTDASQPEAGMDADAAGAQPPAAEAAAQQPSPKKAPARKAGAGKAK